MQIRARRWRTATVAASLLAVASAWLAAPAEAATRSQSKIFYLHSSGRSVTSAAFWSQGGCEQQWLSVSNETGNGSCGWAGYFAQEARKAAGQSYDELTWTTRDGLPLRLDATKPITGTLVVRSHNAQGVYYGVGDATLDLSIKATIDGSDQLLGQHSQTYRLTPLVEVTNISFSFTPPATLHGKTASAVKLTTVARGLAFQHGYIYAKDFSKFTLHELIDV